MPAQRTTARGAKSASSSLRYGLNARKPEAELPAPPKLFHPGELVWARIENHEKLPGIKEARILCTVEGVISPERAPVYCLQAVHYPEVAFTQISWYVYRHQ